MRRPADILLLDEPTNDLDIPSLNVLEESLQEFPGALVLVTHDRYMLDRICSEVLGFTGQGRALFFADYEQWIRAVDEERKNEKAEKNSREKSAKKAVQAKKPGRLSYLDQREYDGMEEAILQAEQEQERLEALMQTPEITSDPQKLQQCWQELETVQQEIARLYNRWEELEEIKNGS